MLIVGITGKAGCGKDTAADRLCHKHGFIKYSMATPLKKMLEVIGVDANNRVTKEIPHPLFGKSPRVMAQTLGTEWMRNCISEEGWINLAGKFVRETQNEETFHVGVVIPDIRFNNEAEWIRRHGFIIHVLREDVMDVATHISEDGVTSLPIDKWICNNDTIEQLNAKVDMVINNVAK